MADRFEPKHRRYFAVWAVVFLGTTLVIFLKPEPKLDSGATKRPDLKVFSNPKFYRTIDKPADFGLEKLNSVVNYLLLTAAAVLAFLAKSVMDVRAELAKGEVKSSTGFRRTHLLFFLHAGIACLFSIVWGVAAYLTLPDISVVESFAITGFLSRCVICQIAGLIVAIGLLLVALGGIVRDLMP